MKTSFSAYRKIEKLSLEEVEQLDEDTLQEIFGFFKNNEKATKEKLAQDASRQAIEMKKKQLSAQKDKLLKATAARMRGADTNPMNDKERGMLTARSRAATGRAAELDWVRGIVPESAQKVLDDLLSGAKKAYQVYHEPVGSDERAVSFALKEAEKQFGKPLSKMLKE